MRKIGFRKYSKMQLHLNAGLSWIRFFGFGLFVKDIRAHQLTFSERNGYAKGIQVGNYYIGFLNRY